nr:Solitary outer membrane autotransporter beta-barrel domain [Vibrio sp. S11_S32]
MSSQLYAQSELRKAGQAYYEQLFASTVVLSDNDLISLGIQSFDPSSVFHTDNDNFGNEDTVQNRKNIAVFTLPLHFNLSEPDSPFQHNLQFRLGYLSISQDLQLADDTPMDNFKQEVYSGFFNYLLKYRLTSNWALGYGFGSYLMYANNSYNFNSQESQILKPFLDDAITNSSAWSTIIEPQIELDYEQHQAWGKWGFSSQWHYFYGKNWGQANDGYLGNPEGWRISNGVKFQYDLSHSFTYTPSLYSSIKRIDIGGDATQILETNSYYEASFGVLLSDLFGKDGWIETVGIGANINYGSALRGGSIILYVNPF